MGRSKALLGKLASLPPRTLWAAAYWIAQVFGRRSKNARSAALEFAHTAWRSWKRHNWRSAIRWSQLSIAVDPKCPDGYLILGLGLLDAGELEKARETYGQGIAVSPADPRLFAALGQLELRAGRLSEAETRLRRAVELKPTEAGWVYDLAQALARLGRKEQAEELAERHAELASGDARLALVLGEARLRRGDVQGAVAVMEVGVQQDPPMAVLHYYLALAYYEMERWADAQLQAETAVNLDPAEESAQRLLRAIESRLDMR